MRRNILESCPVQLFSTPRAFLRAYPQIDLTVAVVERKNHRDCPETASPLLQQLGKGLGDVCCFSLPPQVGPRDSWLRRVITTHGNATVGDTDEGFESNILWGGLRPKEGPIRNGILLVRDKLLSGKEEHVPYPHIRGIVLLCGDFLSIDPYVPFALDKIFRRNGASKVLLVTQMAGDRDYLLLTQVGCDIVKLQLPKGKLAS